MTEKPINLNRVRKARARAAARKTADENAVRFGRTKAERTLQKVRQDHADKLLGGHKLHDGDT